MSLFPADPYFDNVVLLAPFDEANQFNDLSQYKNVGAPFGSPPAVISSEILHFNESTLKRQSFAVSGAASEVQFPDIPAYNLGGDDFTMELDFNFGTTGSPVDNRATLIGQAGGVAGTRSFLFAYDGTGALTSGTPVFYYYYTTDGNTWLGQYGSWEFAATKNQTYHVVWEREGSTIRCFVDGQQLTAGASTPIGTLYNSPRPLFIGDYGDPSFGETTHPGSHIANVRVTKGVVRYKSDFRPPRGPHPTRGIATDNPIIQRKGVVTSGLELYLDAGDRDSYSGSGSTWYDISGNGRDFTISGTPDYVSGQRGYFLLDDTGASQTKYFQRTDANLPPGTGDFTITWWGLKTENFENAYVWDFGSNGGTFTCGTEINDSWRYYNVTTGIGSVLYTNNSIPTFTGSPQTQFGINHAWSEMTVVRESGVTTIYQNNQKMQSASGDTHNINSTTLSLGRYGGNTNLNHIGYYGGFLMYHRALSAAERTQNYEAFERRFKTDVETDDNYNAVVFNASFDGNDGDTSATDFSNSAHPITFGGDAYLDSWLSQFGPTSVRFDGTGDGLTVPDSTDWEFGTGQFTVECWVQWNGDPGLTAMAIVGHYTPTGDERGWAMNLGPTSGNQFRFSWSTDGTATGYAEETTTFNPVSTQWYHLAVSRDSTNLYMFIDGSLSKTVANSANFHPAAAPLSIGMWSDGNQPLNGWIRDLRITKGVCRYTSSFTAPKRQYPTSGPRG